MDTIQNLTNITLPQIETIVIKYITKHITTRDYLKLELYEDTEITKEHYNNTNCLNVQVNLGRSFMQIQLYSLIILQSSIKPFNIKIINSNNYLVDTPSDRSNPVLTAKYLRSQFAMSNFIFGLCITLFEYLYIFYQN